MQRRAAVNVENTNLAQRKARRAELEAMEEAVLGRADALSSVLGMADAGSQSAWMDGGDDNAHADEADTDRQGEPEAASAAWVDADDGDLRVNIAGKARLRKLRHTEAEEMVSGADFEARLRKQFQRVHGTPSWADPTLTRKDEDEDEGTDAAAAAAGTGDDGLDGLTRQSRSLLGGRGGSKLPSTTLDVARVRNANHAAPNQAVVQALEFHPSAPAVMTAGLDKTLRFFHTDGKQNALLQSVHIPNMPIYSARFAAQGSEVIVSGRRKHFYSYDMERGVVKKIPQIQGRSERSLESFYISPDHKHLFFLGHDGTIIMVSARTKQWIANLKMNGSVRALAFTPDSSRMLSSGSDGQVYVWDLGTRECVHIFNDEGCINSTALAVAPKGDFFACGSDSGVVNLYDDSCLREQDPKPIKALMNLTTTISEVAFNHDAQILAMRSEVKKEALKLVHLPSASVFANWPTSGTPLRYVHAMDFSPHSGYLSLGNDRGDALLYRLSHYPSF